MKIPQAEEAVEDASGFVCPNGSCRKVFAHPLKAITVGVSTEPYNACPYCLSEIPVDAEPVMLDSSEENRQSQVIERSETVKSPECKNYLGFLSHRPEGGPIPDECLTCMSIVQCMLKKKEGV